MGNLRNFDPWNRSQILLKQFYVDSVNPIHKIFFIWGRFFRWNRHFDFLKKSTGFLHHFLALRFRLVDLGGTNSNNPVILLFRESTLMPLFGYLALKKIKKNISLCTDALRGTGQMYNAVHGCWVKQIFCFEMFEMCRSCVQVACNVLWMCLMEFVVLWVISVQTSPLFRQ